MNRFRFRLWWLFFLMLVSAIGMLVVRQVIGFGWPNSLTVEFHSSYVKDGKTLSCYVFRDEVGSIACVVVNEVPYAIGMHVSSDYPDWLKAIGRNKRVFVQGKEVVRCEDSFSVFCCKKSGELYVQKFSTSEHGRVDDYLTSSKERKLFDEVIVDGHLW